MHNGQGLAADGPEESGPGAGVGADASPPNPRSRSRRYAQVMAQINEAAIEVFAREGINGATTQAIADSAGLSKAQLHYYIDTKDALYRQVLHDILVDWIRVFGNVDESLGPRKVLADYIRRKMQFSFEQPLRSRIFAAEMMRGGPVALQLMDGRWRSTWASDTLIRHWIQRGLMAPVDPMAFLFHIWAITQFYAEQAEQVRLMAPGKLDSAEGREWLIDEVTTQIFRMGGMALPSEEPI